MLEELKMKKTGSKQIKKLRTLSFISKCLQSLFWQYLCLSKNLVFLLNFLLCTWKLNITGIETAKISIYIQDISQVMINFTERCIYSMSNHYISIADTIYTSQVNIMTGCASISKHKLHCSTIALQMSSSKYDKISAKAEMICCLKCWQL